MDAGTRAMAKAYVRDTSCERKLQVECTSVPCNFVVCLSSLKVHFKYLLGFARN